MQVPQHLEDHIKKRYLVHLEHAEPFPEFFAIPDVKAIEAKE